MKEISFSEFLSEQFSGIDPATKNSLQRKVDRAEKFITKHKNLLVTIAIIYILISAATLVITFIFLRDRQAFLNEKLSNHRWRIASTVYAEPPVIRRGDSVNAEWLVSYLERLNYQKTGTTSVKTSQYHRDPNAVVFQKKSFSGDLEQTFPVQVNFQGDKILNLTDSRSRKPITAYELEPVAISNLFSSQYEKRTLIRYDEIPAHLIHAVVAIEDKRFYQHHGIDPSGIFRAACNNLFEKGGKQGGSTITQQLIKNFYLSSERSYSRKINEAALALLLERKFSKEKILELYLNEIYLGQRGPVSIKGVGEASRFYFHKDIRDINVNEAALLAGMIQGPQRYNPYTHYEKAKDRRDTVLLAMKKEGFITDYQYADYKNSPIAVQAPDTSIEKAPYFDDVVSKQLEEQFSAEELHHGNLRVMTTLNIDMQEAAEEALKEGLAEIDRIRFKRVQKSSQGCLIAIDPRTGAIRALVGGRNYSASQFDRVHQATRQPGSSFKPFIYAAAIELAFQNGQTITPSTFLSDDPLTLEFDGQTWTPKNYDGSYNGIVTVRDALAKSMNIATARLANEVGFWRIASMSKEFGFQNVRAYPSISLGAFEASPWQMAQAYTAFANGGVETKINGIQRVVNSHGEILLQNRTQRKRVLHEQTAFIVTDMLKTVMKSGTGSSISRWRIPQDVAGKTGTTNDFKDAWFVGYTPDLICLVWTGYDDNTPIKMTGAQAALPIWARFMKKISSRLPAAKFEAPEGLVTREIDPTTGKLATPTCMNAVTEVFVEGTEPTEYCTEYDHMQPSIMNAAYQTDTTEQTFVETTEESQTPASIYVIRDPRSKSKTFTNIAPASDTTRD